MIFDMNLSRVPSHLTRGRKRQIREQNEISFSKESS
jgi:hypothetical protein